MEQPIPFFYDVTLRDGNQALAKPWNNAEKEKVFLQLLKLGVQGVEVGFAAASDMDFESCKGIAQLTASMAEKGDVAAQNVVVASLARANKVDIQRAFEADRKSTRLNSSHVRISYAVFCLK